MNLHNAFQERLDWRYKSLKRRCDWTVCGLILICNLVSMALRVGSDKSNFRICMFGLNCVKWHWCSTTICIMQLNVVICYEIGNLKSGCFNFISDYQFVKCQQPGTFLLARFYKLYFTFLSLKPRIELQKCIACMQSNLLQNEIGDALVGANPYQNIYIYKRDDRLNRCPSCRNYENSWFTTEPKDDSYK